MNPSYCPGARPVAENTTGTVTDALGSSCAFVVENCGTGAPESRAVAENWNVSDAEPTFVTVSDALVFASPEVVPKVIETGDAAAVAFRVERTLRNPPPACCTRAAVPGMAYAVSAVSISRERY